MRLLDFLDYREFMRAWIKQLPLRGKGELGKIAKYLGVQSSLLSQILKGDKNFSLEQACLIASYFKLEEYETDYFLLLVQYERAGSEELKRILKKQIKVFREKEPPAPQGISQSGAFVIPEKDKSRFYSSWYFSGIRLLTSLPGRHDLNSISQRFNLPKELVEQVVEFLVKSKLCVSEKDQIKIGPARTHLEADPILSSRHHTNWRLKSLDRLPRAVPPELFFSFPVSISRADSARVRVLILELIEKIDQIVRASEEEKLSCLNIDWFDF